MSATFTFWALAVLALAGAVVVVTTRQVLRLVLGLGAFLLAVAGFYALFGLAFLAVAQVFVYVGGVLVLVLFALMLLARDASGAVELGRRDDLMAATVAATVFATLVVSLWDAVPVPASDAGGSLAGALLGPALPAFELLGLLLLAALVAVLAVVGGGERA